MPSTFTQSLRLTDQANGENSTTWGDLVDSNFLLAEQAIAGVGQVDCAGAADITLTAVNGVIDQARNAVIELTGLRTASGNVIVPAAEKVTVFYNNTSGAFTLTVKTAAGSGVVVPQGRKMALYCDGASVVEEITALGTLDVIGVLTARAAIDESLATSVAAAATANIWAASGNAVHITGNTGPITSLGTAARAGARRLVVFDSNPTLTHGANLILPTGADITAAAGDAMEVLAETTTMARVTDYRRASGESLSIPSTISGNKTFTGIATFQSSDAGSGEIVGIDLDRFSASPANNDFLMALRWLMRDSGGGTDPCFKIVPKIIDVTASAESADVEFWVLRGGSFVKRATFLSGFKLGSPAGANPGHGELAAEGILLNGTYLPTPTVVTDAGATIAPVLADHGKTYKLTSGGAVAFNLPSIAAVFEGYEVGLLNVAGGNATCNRDGADLIDPSASAVVVQNIDGFNLQRWKVIGGKWFSLLPRKFRSANIAIPAGNTALTDVAHSLGAKPNRVEFWLRCAVNNAGYTAGDEVAFGGMFSDSSGAAANNMLVARADATNVSYAYNGASLGEGLPNGGTGVVANITTASWEFFLVAVY